MNTERAYLLHIRDAILRIEEYASVGKAEFLAKSHWQDAIIRQLEIVGEASKRLSSHCVTLHQKFRGAESAVYETC